MRTKQENVKLTSHPRHVRQREYWRQGLFMLQFTRSDRVDEVSPDRGLSKMMRTGRIVSFAALLLAAAAAAAHSAPVKDQVALFATASKEGRTGIAHKTRDVDARPAKPGEVVVTIIKGEGVETKSKPAEAGDFVVRNRCPATGNEEILVKAAKFPTRYGAPQSEPDAQGYRAYKPLGGDMGYFIISKEIGDFSFTAPWGETMLAKVGDAIVQTPSDKSDTYRIAAASFACTYEIVTPAK